MSISASPNAVSGGAHETSRSPGQIGWFGASLLLALSLLAGALTYYGYDFYALDLEARVDHPGFRSLSPSGPVGHGYGLAGTLLILTNLLYLLRRRFARMRLGSMRLWLDIHVFTGFFGTVLIIYHSAFQLRSGIAGLTAVSLGLVVLSGIIGRYFYALDPAGADARLRASADAVRQVWPELGDHLWQVRAELPAPSRLSRPSLLNSLLHLPTWLREARSRRRAILLAGHAAMGQHAMPVRQRKFLATRVTDMATRVGAESKAAAGQHLLRTWRPVHRMMAVLMVVSVTVHIGVAWYFGFRWLWSE